MCCCAKILLIRLNITHCLNKDKLAMPKFLNVANKLLSLRGAITLSDEHDQQVFEAKGEFAFLSPTWRLYRAQLRWRVFVNEFGRGRAHGILNRCSVIL